MKDQQAIHTPGYWASFWHSSQRDSILRQTQHDNPEKWRRFYDKVADIWETMTGGRPCAEMTAALLSDRYGSSLAQKSIIDIGCGTGSLSLALARNGARVTSVDDSRGMIEVLETRHGAEAKKNGGGVQTRACSWTEIEESKQFDAVVAAFFPPAWEPEGITRCERLSKEDCMLVLPTGGDAFPMRSALWSKIMRSNTPKRNTLLFYVFNYLYTRGRRPDIRQISWDERLEIDFESAVFFYTRYFELFGKTGRKIDTQIRDVLESFSSGGKISAAGTTSAAIVMWNIQKRQGSKH